MRIALFVLLGLTALIGLIGLIYGGVMLASSGVRDEARAFVSDISARDYGAAHARLHPSVQDQLGDTGLAEMFAGTEPYTGVSFASINVENRRADLSGTAETATGCVSEVRFVLLSRQITGFEFTPLCPAR